MIIMSNDNCKALEVIRNRQKKLEEIKKSEHKDKEDKECLENLINGILDIFLASDKDAKSLEDMVWHIKLDLELGCVECKVNFNFNKYSNEPFHLIDSKKIHSNYNLKRAMEKLNSTKASIKVLNDVYDYFVNTEEYTAFKSGNIVIITLKHSTICERY